MAVSTEVQHFCNNVTSIRKKYYLSEKSMAMLMGICEEDLLEIESGSLPDSVTVETLFRLHKVFALPVDAFFTEAP